MKTLKSKESFIYVGNPIFSPFVAAETNDKTANSIIGFSSIVKLKSFSKRDFFISERKQILL